MSSNLNTSNTIHVEFDRDLIEKLEGSGPRYTSYPTADRFHTEINATDYQAIIQEKLDLNQDPLSLYIHIPFCNTICYYCACNKIITKDKSRADLYIDYLAKEIELCLAHAPVAHKPDVIQLHLGGGTPTFLSDEQIARLIHLLKDRFNFLADGEYSIEIDPRKVSAATIAHLASLGFNRMSVGIQDFNLGVQQAVNRVQSEEETRVVIDAARANGFQSISVDLIYGLPHQTTQSVQETLKRVLLLDPDRIALYNYAHLPHVFMPQRRILEQDLPSSAVKLDILQNSVQQLMDAGYLFIGMDHFAKPSDELAQALMQGKLQRNFQGYSTHADYDMLSFGVSSIAKIGPLYVQNQKDLDAYYQALDANVLPVQRGIRLNEDDLLRRTLIQNLMCQFELDKTAIKQTFNIDFDEYFATELVELENFASIGLLTLSASHIHIEAKGRFLIRNIAMVFDRHLRERTTHAKYSKVI